MILVANKADLESERVVSHLGVGKRLLHIFQVGKGLLCLLGWVLKSFYQV